MAGADVPADREGDDGHRQRGARAQRQDDRPSVFVQRRAILFDAVEPVQGALDLAHEHGGGHQRTDGSRDQRHRVMGAGLLRLTRGLGQHLPSRPRCDRPQRVDDQFSSAAGPQDARQADERDHSLHEDQRRRIGHRARVAESIGPPQTPEGVSHERPPSDVFERLFRVVTGQPVRLRDCVRSAHDPSLSGTHTVIA